MKHSQALGKRERLERAAASSIKKQRVRERLKRLQELREVRSVEEFRAFYYPEPVPELEYFK